MSGRTLAIGDIHGCDTALTTLLGQLQITADDTVVLLGDSFHDTKAIPRMAADDRARLERLAAGDLTEPAAGSRLAEVARMDGALRRALAALRTALGAPRVDWRDLRPRRPASPGPGPAAAATGASGHVAIGAMVVAIPALLEPALARLKRHAPRLPRCRWWRNERACD